MAAEAESKRVHGRKPYVLDTFAILAWFANEPGAAAVQQLLEEARRGKSQIYVSWVNLSEVYYVTLRYSEEAERSTAAMKALEILKTLPLELVPAGEREALAAGAIKADYSLSLADAFAAGLAKLYAAEVVTGDPEFRAVEQVGDIRVVWLPQKPKGRKP